MKADELREKLEAALKPDVSYRTTPLERVLPVLKDIIEALDEHEGRIAQLEPQKAP